MSAWVSQVAKSERIDTSMLATRADLVALLSGDPDAAPRPRVARAICSVRASGACVDGHAALTFDRGKGLRLVDVSQNGDSG